VIDGCRVVGGGGEQTKQRERFHVSNQRQVPPVLPVPPKMMSPVLTGGIFAAFPPWDIYVRIYYTWWFLVAGSPITESMVCSDLFSCRVCPKQRPPPADVCHVYIHPPIYLYIQLPHACPCLTWQETAGNGKETARNPSREEAAAAAATTSNKGRATRKK
jgi:hypothetical protein